MQSSQFNQLTYIVLIKSLQTNMSQKDSDTQFQQQINYITIFYRTFMGNGDRITLLNTTTIQQLTNIISKNLGENPDNMELYNLGRFLKNKQTTLEEYGVKSNSIVHVSVVFQQFKNMHHNLIQERAFKSSLSGKRNDISLIIQIVDNKITLSMSSMQSVQSLKNKIQRISSFQANNILLFYGEKQLKNDSTLQECGIITFAILRGQVIFETDTKDFRQLNIEDNFFEKQQSIKQCSEINVLKRSDISSQDPNQMYYFMKDSLKEDHEDIKDFIQNIKLSESVDIQSSNADIQIPYFYEGVEGVQQKINGRQVKIFKSDNPKEYQKANWLTVSNNVPQRKRSLQIRQSRWQGPCQLYLQNKTKTFALTVFVNSSCYKIEQLSQFMQKKLGTKTIQFFNFHHNKFLQKNTFLYALPWQSTILNGLLHIYMLFCTEQDEK